MELDDGFRNVDCSIFKNSLELSKFSSDDKYSRIQIFHLNIRSYAKNFDSLLIYLEAIQNKFDFIILTEAWLSEDTLVDSLAGYDMLRTVGQRNRNDGVIVYANSSLSVEAREIVFGDVYGLTIDFTVDRRHCNLIALYRTHDSDIDMFLHELDRHYSLTMKRNYTYLLTGDVNINILKADKHVDQYLNILTEHGFVSCINVPTRETSNSSSCLDHVFINHCDYDKVRAAVAHTHVTDHYSCVAEIKFNLISGRNRDTDGRIYIHKPSFRRFLQNVTWETVLESNDVNQSCNFFHDIINDVLNKSTKHLLNDSSRSTILKPWITKGLIISIRKRDKLSKLVKSQPFNSDLIAFFKRYRNNLASTIKHAKREYYRGKLIECGSNSRMFWRIINEISGKDKSKNTFPLNKYLNNSQQDLDLDVCKHVANEFNNFFSSVGSNLASAIDSSGTLIVNDSDFSTDSTFTLRPVNELDILQQVNSLRGQSAPGYDGVSASLLKDNVDILMIPLLHITNLSISTGKFPCFYKLAKVIPLYKSNNASDKNNFRPISLLSVFCKVIEKIVKKQLVDYLTCFEILSPCQFGFRQDNNISDALLALTRNISNALSNNKRCLVAFLDLAKAFDSVDRNRLLNKLKLLGIKGKSFSWFESYLSGRKQMVTICGVNSEEMCVDYGVVQGSTLGPVLFLLYINNLAKVQIEGKFSLFADDTAIFFEGDSWDEVKAKSMHGLSMVYQWFNQNLLTLNVSKTKFMPFSLRNATDFNESFVKLHSCGNATSEICSCKVIEKVDNYKYLGVIFDKRLRWSDHIYFLQNKLRKLIFVFKKLKEILNFDEIRVTYFAYFQSVISAGILAWGGAYRSVLEPLNIIQKAVIKVALGKGRRYPTEELFVDMKVLSPRQLYVRALLIYMFKNEEKLFERNPHHYLTRYARNTNVKISKLNKTFSVTSSFYIMQMLKRNIPIHLKSYRNMKISSYKKLVGSWLFEIGRNMIENVIISCYR